MTHYGRRGGLTIEMADETSFTLADLDSETRAAAEAAAAAAGLSVEEWISKIVLASTPPSSVTPIPAPPAPVPVGERASS